MSENAENGWQMGRLELGRLSGPSKGSPNWCLDDGGELYWYGCNEEPLPVGSFVWASNEPFANRRALMCLDGDACFVEFPTHYVSNAYDASQCLMFLDHVRHLLNPSKPVLSGKLIDGSIMAFPVTAPDSVWVGAVYRLRTVGEVAFDADLLDDAVRTRMRSLFRKNQAYRDRFVLNPFLHRDDATCFALVTEHDFWSRSIDGCAFNGLLPTPSAGVSARLLKEIESDLRGGDHERRRDFSRAKTFFITSALP